MVARAAGLHGQWSVPGESPWANRDVPRELCGAQLGWRNSQLSVPWKAFWIQYSNILD